MIRPLHDSIVVKPDPAEIPSSLLILPPEETKKVQLWRLAPEKGCQQAK